MSLRRFRPRLLWLLVLLLALAGGAHAYRTIYVRFNVNAPAALAGSREYGVVASFGREVNASLEGELVAVRPPLACAGPLSPANLTGRIALVQRGNCPFVEKARLAQAAGAIGIVVMGTGEVLGGDDANHSVTAFAVGVEQRVGDKWAPLAPLRVTISPVDASAWDWAFLLLASLAVFVVWLGAYVSSRKERAVAAGDPNASRIDDTMHVELTNRAAMTFLACSSLALVVLFFFIGYLVYLLIALFTFIGAMALFELLIGSAEERCPPHWRRPLFSLPFVGDVTPVMLACFLPSATLALVWVVGRKAWWAWPLQDLLGVAILVTMQRAVRLTSIRVSTVLLTLAFFYDIFWVFLSPFIFRRSVMITVATGGDSGESPPMLLVIPKLVHEGPGNGFSMLGLGDVALPGLLLSMLMRFDLSNALSGLAGYFVPALIGYAVGLAAAGIAVAVTLSGQPALLYLVPCTLGLTVLLAWHRGHLGVLWRGRGRGDPENVPLSAQEAQSATAGGFSMLSQDDEVASDEDDAEPRASIQASRPNAEDATAPAGAPTPV